MGHTLTSPCGTISRCTAIPIQMNIYGTTVIIVRIYSPQVIKKVKKVVHISRANKAICSQGGRFCCTHAMTITTPQSSESAYKTS